MKQYIISDTMKEELEETGRTSETAVDSPFWQRFYEELAGLRSRSLARPYEYCEPVASPPLVKLRYLQDVDHYPIDYLCRAVMVQKIRKYSQDGEPRGLFLKLDFRLEEKIAIEAERTQQKKGKRR